MWINSTSNVFWSHQIPRNSERILFWKWCKSISESMFIYQFWFSAWWQMENMSLSSCLAKVHDNKYASLMWIIRQLDATMFQCRNIVQKWSKLHTRDMNFESSTDCYAFGNVLIYPELHWTGNVCISTINSHWIVMWKVANSGNNSGNYTFHCAIRITIFSLANAAYTDMYLAVGERIDVWKILLFGYKT